MDSTGLGLFPTPKPAGEYTGIVNAWNGGALDPTRNRLYVYGGGHADYSGNEIYYFQLDSLLWRRQTNPTPLSADSSVYFLSVGENPASAYYRIPHPDVNCDSLPRAIHTYDGIEYLPNQDRVFQLTGSTASEPGGGQGSSFWFDPATGAYSRRAHTGISTAAYYLEAATGYDPVTGHLFMTNGGNGMYEYDPDANTWTKRSNDAGGSYRCGAVDPVRRKFIVLGGDGPGDGTQRLYSYDLTTYARTRVYATGDTAIYGYRYPSIVYDPVADRMVAHAGGGDVYSLNVSTWVWTKHTTVSPAVPKTRISAGNKFGDFGRWQYWPKKNVYVLVDSTGTDVWFYKLPVISRIDMNLQTWRSRPLPAQGVGPGPLGSKHMRIAVNEDDQRLYFLGGDYSTNSPNGVPESGRQEVYSYSVKDSNWVYESPYCVPAGLQPQHPDEVGWTWDSRRKKFWMIPGYMGTGDTECGNGALVRDSIFTFDPATDLWTWRGDIPNNPYTATIGDNGFAVYDSLRDEITQFVYTGNWKATRLDMDSLGWSQTNFNQNADVAKEYTCYDKVGRKLYVIDAYSGDTGGVYNAGHHRLLVYDMDTFAFDTLATVPGGTPTGRAQTHPVWDSVNEKILWLDWCCDSSAAASRMLVYHPEANQWETKSAQLPDGSYAYGNTTVYDPYQNVLIAYGGRTDVVGGGSNFFMYRYGNGDGVAYAAAEGGGGGTPGVTVGSISGHTTEGGGTATFTLVLDAEPTASVSIGLTSDDTTEGTISPASVTFTTGNWATPQTVTLTGVDDGTVDGNITYNAVTGTCTGASEYTAINPANVAVVNDDNDSANSAATKKRRIKVDAQYTPGYRE